MTLLKISILVFSLVILGTPTQVIGEPTSKPITFGGYGVPPRYHYLYKQGRLAMSCLKLGVCYFLDYPSGKFLSLFFIPGLSQNPRCLPKHPHYKHHQKFCKIIWCAKIGCPAWNTSKPKGGK